MAEKSNEEDKRATEPPRRGRRSSRGVSIGSSSSILLAETIPMDLPPVDRLATLLHGCFNTALEELKNDPKCPARSSELRRIEREGHGLLENLHGDPEFRNLMESAVASASKYDPEQDEEVNEYRRYAASLRSESQSWDSLLKEPPTACSLTDIGKLEDEKYTDPDDYEAKMEQLRISREQVSSNLDKIISFSEYVNRNLSVITSTRLQSWDYDDPQADVSSRSLVKKVVMNKPSDKTSDS